MDFLDPKKERANFIKLLLGYGLITIAISIATLVLLYEAYGYSLNSQGQITQNGLLFISSQPTGASIYLNNTLYSSTTNTRAIIPAGPYNLKITDAGYRDWDRPVYVAGGDVQHFDYPFLFPTKLQTTDISDLSTDPSIATQSPNQRWLLLGRSDNSGTFSLYDMSNPAKPVETDITLPSSVYTAGTGNETWGLEEWAGDNTNVVLLHTYVTNGTTNREYIMLNVATPANSVNLTKELNLSQQEQLSLYNGSTSQFYIYDPVAQNLQHVNSDGSVDSTLPHVIAYKTYGTNQILYVTDHSPDGKITAGQDSVVLLDGHQSYILRTLPADAASYDLNMAQYAGDWYVAVAASNGSFVYIYMDPQNQLLGSDGYPDPWRRLPLNDPSYLAFSANTQFLMAESGQNFYVYDFENIAQYSYTATQPLDQPQAHATWMDGDRIMYVSNGKMVVFDYDYRNQQTLVAANPAYVPVFSANYKYLYTLRPGSADGTVKPALTSTSMLVP